MATDKPEAVLPVADSTSVGDRMKSFDALLKNIETLDDKKRALWLDVYQNAITDRANAYMMFATLVRIAEQKSVEFAVHGRTIASYLERMSRANDQLLKLAELIANAERKASGVDSADLFDRISKGRSS